MSETLTLVLTVSLVVMAGELVYRLFTRSARLLPRLLALAAAFAIVRLLAPGAVQTRGSVDEAAAIAFCYASMLLGMMAEYVYAQAERGNRKLEFNLLEFLMPVFASPIVFIPLLTLTSEVAAGGAFTRAKVMVYFIAFQNGFFWKSFFEQRRAAARAAPSGEAAVV
jgi:cyanate permease